MKKTLLISIICIACLSLVAQDFPWQSQLDNRWNKESLGFSYRNTINRSGCALTCLSMLFNSDASNNAVHPGEFNEWMQANGGFVGADLRWNVAAGYDGYGEGVEHVAETNNRNDWEFLADELAKGNKVVVKVGGNRGHWVLVIDRKGPINSASSYIVNDPGTRIPKLRTLANWGGFKKAHSYSGQWIDSKNLVLTTSIQASKVSEDELFIYKIQNINDPADAIIRVESKLTLPIKGYFMLCLYDQDENFVDIVANEYTVLEPLQQEDMLFGLENYTKIKKENLQLRLLFTKQLQPEHALADAITLKDLGDSEDVDND